MFNKIRETLFDFFRRKEIIITDKEIEFLFKEILIEMTPLIGEGEGVMDAKENKKANPSAADLV